MRLTRHEVPAHLRIRMCPACGYRGERLQGPGGPRTFVCPACGADLYSRPARTYAEMEGLDDDAPGTVGAAHAPPAVRSAARGTVRRCLTHLAVLAGRIFGRFPRPR